MHTKKTSATLKQGARGIMLGKYRNAISILLASDLIVSTLSLLTSTSTGSFVSLAIGFKNPFSSVQLLWIDIIIVCEL